MTTPLGAAVGTVAGVAALGVAGVGYAAVVERNWFALRRFTMPVLAPGSRPLRILQVSDLHLVPRQRRRIEWVRGLAALSPTSSSTPVTTSPRAMPSRGRCTRWSRSSRSPGCSSRGPTTTTRRCRRTRRATSPGTTPRPPEPGELPIEDLRAGFRDGGWVDLDNARDHALGGWRRGGAGRHRRRPHQARRVCRGGRPRLDRGGGDDRRDPRPLPAGARPDGGRRSRAGARRAHPRRPAALPFYGAWSPTATCRPSAPRASRAGGPERVSALVCRAGRRRLAARVGRARAPRPTAGAVLLPPRGHPAHARPTA